MSVSLRKPTHVLAYMGTQNGGDHDLEIRGVIVGRSSTVVKIIVTRVKGGMTGLLYGHLNGTKIEIPLIVAHLF